MHEEDDRAPLVERVPSDENHLEDFTFEPHVQAALAREITEFLLPALLVDALKKANGETAENSGSGPAIDDESEKEYIGGPVYRR
ncbi:hypothetical protein L1987_57579 [Smallanthus sonchifolius]|uniref:Uncharacterized protein n=1 Tax=Smallanthus sonchifolius TaxID=185202 RepID=A0ACB9DD72_9ASTR|nr:hypothetical protein L1987_57579 [Smallanthus sonchifolius]